MSADYKSATRQATSLRYVTGPDQVQMRDDRSIMRDPP
jgi:hypothetical protein